MKIFSLIMILTVSIPSFAEEIPGETLLKYFSAGCKSKGQWTDAALSNTYALVNTLNAMRNDGDCTTAAGAISQLNNLSFQLATLKKLDANKNDLATYNAQEQELLIQLTKTSNPATLDEINTHLREIQLNRAVILNGSKAAERLSGEDQASVLGQIAQSANASFQQITANQKCLDKNPGLLASAANIVSVVGSAVTLVNPAIGISMTAGATFANVSMDGIKKSRNARDVRKISDDTVNFQAYSCALESMSNLFCQSKDAEAFIKFKSSNRKLPLNNKGLSQAIRLNEREIPAILEWLNNIKNGVTPQNTADSDKISVIRLRDYILKRRTDFGLSLIEEKRKTYDSYAGLPDDGQWKYLRTIIRELAPAPQMSSGGPRDPFDDIYTPAYAPFFLSGMKENDTNIRDATGSGFKDFMSWEKPDIERVTLDTVKSQYLTWIASASNRVNRELSEAQQPDPLLTLNSAYMTTDAWKVAPLDAFKTIADFLEANPPGTQEINFKKIYLDTLKKLRSIHDITTTAILTGDMSAQLVGNKNLTPIEQIYEIAQLNYGIVVLQARLEMIVKLSLLEYINSSPQEDQVLIAQLLAADRFYETISRMNGITDPSQHLDDIHTGMAYTMKNLASFMDIFGFNINRALRRLYQEEQSSDSTVETLNRKLRTKMCFLVLSAENAEKYIEVALCKGLKMEPMEPDAPTTDFITAATFQLNLSKRACIYREFFRENAIYNSWNIKTR